ncbi:MAG: DUF4430 domain-containing protein [Oscillospiraceae bacterium]|nr:DUF4430 domain-containing protein [Oscillospiraceae bacterium]
MKKKISNIIMVALIAVILITGVCIALSLQKKPEESLLGSDFKSAEIPNETGENTCTITILCDTVLAHPDQLNQAKAPYVPADGVVLAKTTVAFTTGESVFDVLQRTCQKGNIQLEYSWTPIYDSYYVEGINHLYEFDCGPESGWMYKVGGSFPNYGCSSYEVQSGDDIVWCYTCVRLGTDVGAERMD